MIYQKKDLQAYCIALAFWYVYKIWGQIIPYRPCIFGKHISPISAKASKDFAFGHSLVSSSYNMVSLSVFTRDPVRLRHAEVLQML
jgi:hypothetical protein